MSNEEKAIRIYNPTSDAWTHVRISLNETDNNQGFQTGVPMLAAGVSTPIYFHDLIRDDGLRFNHDDYAVRDVTFTADQGSYHRIPCDKTYTLQFFDDLRGGK